MREVRADPPGPPYPVAGGAVDDPEDFLGRRLSWRLEREASRVKTLASTWRAFNNKQLLGGSSQCPLREVGGGRQFGAATSEVQVTGPILLKRKLRLEATESPNSRVMHLPAKSGFGRRY